jgi:hypothetical protein
MRINTKYLILSFMLLASLGAECLFAKTKPQSKVKFEPVDTVRSVAADFPYEAVFEFRKMPEVLDSATLHLQLKSKRDIRDTIALRVVTGEDPYLEIGIDTIMWPLPRKDKRFEVDIPIRFLMGGSYFIMFEHALPFERTYSLYQLEIAFGLDGKALYFGKRPSPVSGCPGHFYTSNMKEIRLRLLNRSVGARRRMGIPYEMDLTISPVPRVNETSKVDFTLKVAESFTRNIQFEWSMWPSIRLYNLPASWDGRPRVGDTYSGSFEFKVKAPGYAMFEFSAFGQSFFAKYSDTRRVDVPIHMVFDSSGALLYLGSVDPHDCRLSESDLMAEQYIPLSIVPVDRVQMMSARSEPDFEAMGDSACAPLQPQAEDRATIDSILRSFQQDSVWKSDSTAQPVDTSR